MLNAEIAASVRRLREILNSPAVAASLPPIALCTTMPPRAVIAETTRLCCNEIEFASRLSGAVPSTVLNVPPEHCAAYSVHLQTLALLFHVKKIDTEELCERIVYGRSQDGSK